MGKSFKGRDDATNCQPTRSAIGQDGREQPISLSNLHYLGLFGGQNLVKLLDIFGGVLLHLSFGAMQLIVRDLFLGVTRFDDLSEVEDWITAGIPVILSARWDWLLPGRPVDNDGHLIVCIGFTENGDVVINDPATRLGLGESVRRIYKREGVIHSWTKSHNAVYLVYPDDAKIPRNTLGHW